MAYDNVSPQGQPFIRITTSFSPTPSIPENLTSPYHSKQIPQSFKSFNNNNEKNNNNTFTNNDNNKNSKEFVAKKVITKLLTPHKVTLLIIIKEFFHEKYKDILCSVMVLLIKELNVLNNPRPCELYQLFQKIENLELKNEKIELIKSTIYQKLNSIQSPDDLLNFFSDIKQLVVDRNALIDVSVEQQLYVDKSSIIGVFIRRCILEMNQMAFDDISNFFLSIVYYVKKYDRHIPEHRNKRQKTNNDEMNLHIYENIEPIPLNDIQDFITRQIDLLYNCSGELPSNELQQKLIQIHKYLPSIANIYYLSFMNCLYSKEKESTLEQLYRFFDYSGILNYNKNKTLYQYGLINLAMFHSFFGEIEMEKRALEEAVYMSKRNKDYECLSYSLCWLNKLVNSDMVVSKEKSIASSKRIMNSYEITNPNMMLIKCLDELGKIRYGINMGIKPTYIFKSLIQGEYMIKSNLSQNLFGSCLLLKSSIWSIYGNNILSNLAVQIQLNYYDDDISQESKHLGICKLAKQHAIHGNYYYAFSLLNNSLRKSKNAHHCENWLRSKMAIQFHRSLFQRQLLNSRIIHSFLMAMDSENFESDVEAYIRKGLFLIKCHCEKSAYDSICNILEKKYKYTSSLKRFNSLLYISEIFMNCSSNVSALYNLLECLSLSESYHFHNLYIYTAARIAQLLLDINMYDKSLEIMDSILPAVLTNEDLWIQSLCLLIEVKCLMARLSENFSILGVEDENKKKSELLDMLSVLERSYNGFKRMEGYVYIQEVAYLQSLIYNELGNIQERDKKAKEFHQMEKLILSNRRIISYNEY